MKECTINKRPDVENEISSGASGGIVAGFRTFFKNCHVVSGFDMLNDVKVFLNYIQAINWYSLKMIHLTMTWSSQAKAALTIRH